MTIFADSINWDLLLRTSQEAIFSQNQRPALIPPVTAATNSRYLIVKINSELARPWWRLGCWASARVAFEPSSVTSILTVGVEVMKESCGLAKANLLEIPDYEAPPYLLILEFPRWLKSVDVEVWYYNP